MPAVLLGPNNKVMVFKSVQSKYVASYFQLTASMAPLVCAVSLVEMECGRELSRHLLKMVVKSVILRMLWSLVMMAPVLVST